MTDVKLDRYTGGASDSRGTARESLINKHIYWDSQKVLSKILAETKFVQKVLTTLNSN